MNGQNTRNQQNVNLQGFNQNQINENPMPGAISWRIEGTSTRNAGGLRILRFTDGSQTVRVHTHVNLSYPTVLDDIHGNRLNDSTERWDPYLADAVKNYLRMGTSAPVTPSVAGAPTNF